CVNSRSRGDACRNWLIRSRYLTRFSLFSPFVLLFTFSATTNWNSFGLTKCIQFKLVPKMHVYRTIADPKSCVEIVSSFNFPVNQKARNLTEGASNHGENNRRDKGNVNAGLLLASCC
ncbi:unnamed protein product, partial [Brassica oleracea]